MYIYILSLKMCKSGAAIQNEEERKKGRQNNRTNRKRRQAQQSNREILTGFYECH